MVLAQSGLTRQQESRAVFEFTLAGNDNDLLITASDGTKSSNSLADTPASQTDQKEKFFVEFSHPELFSFFNDLDRIQKQLDSMT